MAVTVGVPVLMILVATWMDIRLPADVRGDDVAFWWVVGALALSVIGGLGLAVTPRFRAVGTAVLLGAVLSAALSLLLALWVLTSIGG